MNAVMNQVSMFDQTQRNELHRRRHAEAAYDRHVKLNVENQKKLDKLESLLAEPKGSQPIETEIEQFVKLGAGQVKQVAIPIGKTLEETIEMWKNVRSEAISVPEPTTADYQLAATASSKIMKTEAQLALQQKVEAEIELAAKRKEAASGSLHPQQQYEIFEMKKRVEKAISSYAFQVEMKANGFKMDLPSFYKIA